jgi:hypothetical protein
MKHARHFLCCSTLICLNTFGFSEPTFSENITEPYIAPPEESEFIPFGEEIDGYGTAHETETPSTDTIASSIFTDEPDANTNNYYYLGGDLGASFLKPSINGISYSETGMANIGFFGGFYWNPRTHFEAQYHQLGSVKVQLKGNNIKIDYKVYNFDVVFDFLQTPASHYFISTGITALEATSNVAVNQDKNTGIKAGFGYERFFNDQWSTRITYQQFSGDAGLLSIGLNRHFDRIINMKPKKNNSF